MMAEIAGKIYRFHAAMPAGIEPVKCNEQNVFTNCQSAHDSVSRSSAQLGCISVLGRTGRTSATEEAENHKILDNGTHPSVPLN
jgi:hypothetical protein